MTITLIILGSIAVGVTIFIMVILNTEHPPAVGMALALVIHPWTERTLFFVLGAVLFMEFVKTILKDQLINMH